MKFKNIGTAWLVLLFVSILLFSRFYNLAKFPGAEWDESTYQCIGQNFAQFGKVFAKDDIEVKSTQSDGGYWYQPPFYFMLLGEWFKITASNDLSSARQLAALANALMVTTLFLFSKHLLGSWKKALLPVLLITCDAWLLLSSRTAWFENHMMLLGVLSLIFWHHAGEEKNENKQFLLYALAGLLAGSAFVFKLLGVVFPLAMALHWMTQPRKNWRYRLVCLYLTFLVALAYVFYGLLSGHENFISQTLHQFLRGVSPTVKSGGVNFNLTEAIKITLSSTYILFIPSITLLGTAGLILFKDFIKLLKGKEVDIMACWAATAIGFFAVIRLRNPHYAMMYVTPAAFYLGLKLAECPRKWSTIIFSAYIAISVLAIGVRANIPDSALSEAREYITQNIYSQQVIVTEESIGCGIPQQYLNIRLRKNREPSKLVEYKVQYVVFIQSRSYQPTMEPEFKKLVNKGSVIKKFEDYKWSIYVVDLQ